MLKNTLSNISGVLAYFSNKETLVSLEGQKYKINIPVIDIFFTLKNFI